jgi:hypothetical protein
MKFLLSGHLEPAFCAAHPLAFRCALLLRGQAQIHMNLSRKDPSRSESCPVLTPGVRFRYGLLQTFVDLVMFERTCAVKYPQNLGSRREPPTLPAFRCANWHAEWASLKARCWRTRAVSIGRNESRRQRAWRSRQRAQSSRPVTQPPRRCRNALRGTSSEWRALQTRFSRTLNQCRRPKFSTAHATWSDSITWHGVITGWSVSLMGPAPSMSVS